MRLIQYTSQITEKKAPSTNGKAFKNETTFRKNHKICHDQGLNPQPADINHSLLGSAPQWVISISPSCQIICTQSMASKIIHDRRQVAYVLIQGVSQFYGMMCKLYEYRGAVCLQK